MKTELLNPQNSALILIDFQPQMRITAGQLADLAVLSADYFTVPEDEIKGIESLLTVTLPFISIRDPGFAG